MGSPRFGAAAAVAAALTALPVLAFVAAPSAGAATAPAPLQGVTAQAAAPELPETGMIDTKPYMIGGSCFLVAGAGLIANAARRSRRAAMAADPSEPGASDGPDGPDGPAPDPLAQQPVASTSPPASASAAASGTASVSASVESRASAHSVAAPATGGRHSPDTPVQVETGEARETREARDGTDAAGVRAGNAVGDALEGVRGRAGDGTSAADAEEDSRVRADRARSTAPSDLVDDRVDDRVDGRGGTGTSTGTGGPPSPGEG
ncbi:hypothetical protein [Actinacidiphila yeochonensis]|uniref:hypothetical protein n=1 Tax=Actinacidiphila yeochonensis TaxID=89050 RepID=UPI00068C11E3|nr:hypothetical protein [Actinacidiphila yeochonensis]